MAQVPEDNGCTGFTFPLLRVLNDESRESAAILLGLDVFGEPTVGSRTCLFTAEATSMFSAYLLREPFSFVISLFVLSFESFLFNFTKTLVFETVASPEN